MDVETRSESVVAAESARSGSRPPPPASRPNPPRLAGPRRPPPLPPRRKAAAKPPVPVRLIAIELLDVEPDPDSTQPTSTSAHEMPGPGGFERMPSRDIAHRAVIAAAVFVAGVAIPLLVPHGSANAVRRNEAPVQAPAPPLQVLPSPKPEPPVAPLESAPATTAEPPAEPPQAEPAAADAIPPNIGELQMPASAAEHRIYVDGRTVSEGTDPVRVRCGPHTVRIGSAGRVQHLDVPCGSALQLTR